MAQDPLTFVFRSAPTSIDTIDVDAATVITHVKRNAVTRFPVEDGQDISDHKRTEPDQITIDGVITNAPINLVQRQRVIDTIRGPVTVTTGELFDGAEGRAKAADERFVKLLEEGTLVSVVTSLRTYSDMMIESYTVPKDRTVGDALRFSVTLTKIRIVSSKVTEVVLKVKGKAKIGPQVPRVTPLSLAQKASDALGSLPRDFYNKFIGL